MTAQRRDRAGFVLGLVRRWLPEERHAWGDAMSAELARIDGRAERRRFAVGCVRVALVPSRAGPQPSRTWGGAILASSAAVLALGLYSQERIAADASIGGHGVLYTTCATALGIVVAVAYVFIALRLAGSTTQRARVSRRYGVTTGALIGTVVLLANTPVATKTFGARHAVLASSAVAGLGVMAATLIAGSLAARAGGDRRAGRDAGIWAGMTGGFVLLTGLLIVTFAATGWITHDPATINAYRDSFNPAHFAGYHTHYATITGFVDSENQDTALLGGLLWLPILSIALGTLGGMLRPTHPD
jgi:hypothetical protein